MSPNRFENPAVYLQSGDPEKEDTPTLHAPGLLGSRFTVINPVGQPSTGTPAGSSKRYQYVKTDSTMTVSPYPGATAYWADKTAYLVTTVNTNLNAIAGVFRNSPTKGNYTCVQFDGRATVKLVDGDVATSVSGDSIIGSAATAGKGARIAAGTAPTYQPLGYVSTPLLKYPADALVVVDLNIPETT